MLLRFSVENAFCFYEKATLSMIAGKDLETHQEHLIKTPLKSGHDVLKAAAIYGANDHGKSNFIKVLEQLKSLILGDGVFNFPYFKLNHNAKNEPAKLILEFINHQRAYEYGVVIQNGNKIIEEWLYDITEIKEGIVIFHREKDKDGKNNIRYGDKVEFPKKDPSGKTDGKKYVEIISNNINDNFSLTAHMKNNKITILDWFFDYFSKINIVNVGSFHNNLINFFREHEGAINKKIQEIYIGVKRIKITKEIDKSPDPRIEKILSLIPRVGDPLAKGVGEYSRDDEGNIYYETFIFVREDKNGQEIEFSIKEESEGTQRFLNLLPLALDDDQECLFVIDELDRSLHPLLARNLLQNVFKKKKTQIIFTTHQPYLMGCDLLRKDEIWFVQKRYKEGSAELFSLLEMKTPENENYEVDYMLLQREKRQKFLT